MNKCSVKWHKLVYYVVGFSLEKVEAKCFNSFINVISKLLLKMN